MRRCTVPAKEDISKSISIAAIVSTNRRRVLLSVAVVFVVATAAGGDRDDRDVASDATGSGTGIRGTRGMRRVAMGFASMPAADNISRAGFADLELICVVRFDSGAVGAGGGGGGGGGGGVAEVGLTRLSGRDSLSSSADRSITVGTSE